MQNFLTKFFNPSHEGIPFQTLVNIDNKRWSYKFHWGEKKNNWSTENENCEQRTGFLWKIINVIVTYKNIIIIRRRKFSGRERKQRHVWKTSQRQRLGKELSREGLEQNEGRFTKSFKEGWRCEWRWSLWLDRDKSLGYSKRIYVLVKIWYI